MSSAERGLIVDSVTGIDVALPVAGPGARAYAFLIDWHIRTILALAWYVVGALLYNRRASLAPPLLSEAPWFAGVVAPTLAIYFLYHYVVELAMYGRTPGKRMAGVRIATRDGAVPGAGALLIRNVFRLVDSLPLFYPVGLISVIMTRHHVRIGDMAAGTLLVFERAETALSVAFAEARASALDAQGAEIVAELLERWPTLGAEARVQLARQLLARYRGADAEESGPADEATWRSRLERLARPQE